MGRAAEIIALSEVRARMQWQRLRDTLHVRFGQWLDGLQAQLPDPKAHLAKITEAVGLRLYLLDGERIVHVLSWHQVQHDHALGEALRQVKEAGLIPAESVRLCVVCDGAEWIWKHIEELFPTACQVLDDDHCAQYLHKAAKAQYADPIRAQEGVEATLTRLYVGKGGQVLGGLRRMQPTSDEALKAIDNCRMHLDTHRCRTTYGTFRRGGYPLGSGGMESANKFICHLWFAHFYGGSRDTSPSLV